MQNIELWPLYPVLPVKRPASGGAGWPGLGVMVAGKGPIVYLVTIYDSRLIGAVDNALKDLPHVAYETYAALLDDDWQVD
jgi:hypothetical protein